MTRTLLISALTLLLALPGCGKKDQSKEQGGAHGPTQVGFVVVQTTSVPLVTELGGRVSAFQSAEVRPQVAGVIRRRFFTEGSIVKQGQTLYQIDPSLYQAAAKQAEANLSSSQANAEAASVRAGRYRPLAQQQAISQQEYTDAAAQSRQATASVAQGRAQLETARINLRFTRVPSPITGRIGRSLFTEGALVTTGQTDPLAVIQRLDPTFVDIQQSSAEMLALRRALAKGGIMPVRAVVRLALEDGSQYGITGTVEFAESIVDAGTGTVTLRARFANPDSVLLPGMFVRASFEQGRDDNAFLVPQVAVSREPTGAASVFIVGPNNRAIQRKVEAQRTQGEFWVVTKGLQPGDKVIVQGLGRLRTGAPIRPVPASTPQRIAPPPAKQG